MLHGLQEAKRYESPGLISSMVDVENAPVVVVRVLGKTREDFKHFLDALNTGLKDSNWLGFSLVGRKF